MLRRSMIFPLLLAGAPFAAPATGSRLVKGITDYLPNLAETNFVISLANVYMQASSLVRTVNASVSSMTRAVDELQAAQVTADRLWGSIQSLQNVNIYDMDSWAEGLSTMRYDIISMGVMQINDLLASSAIDFAEGTLGGYIKGANGLSYDAREAGVKHAFNAYYYQQDWAEYKSTHGLDQQSAQVKDKQDQYDALQEQREEMRAWICPEGTTPEDCDQMIAANKIRISAIESQMESINQDISDITLVVSVNQLKRNASVMQMGYLESALQKVHLSAPDYATAYEQINTASAALARKAQRFITGRLSSPARDPEPRPSSDLKGPSVAELCSRPENLVTRPDGSTSCLYSEDDGNKTAAPEETWDRSDLEGLGPDNEGPRDVALSDFQKLKAELAYINLMQEQLLFDMEMDQAYLYIAYTARQIVKKVDHRPKLNAVQEGLGLAAVIGNVNGFKDSDVRMRHNKSLMVKAPWDMSQSFGANYAK